MIKAKLNTTKSLFRSRDSILLTAGIGDFFAIDSFLDDNFRSGIKMICYATRAARDIAKLISSCPAYKTNIRHHIISQDEKVYISASEVKKYLMEESRFQDLNYVSDCADLSISQVFNNCQLYTNSSFLTYKISDIRISLPENFYVLYPYSVNFIEERDFDEGCWEFVESFINKEKIKLVTLGLGDFNLPKNLDILNLLGKTDICEAVEILKRASGYIGIDSAFSVLASKLFSPANLFIRARSKWTDQAKSVYFAPNSEFQFLHKELNKNIFQ